MSLCITAILEHLKMKSLEGPNNEQSDARGTQKKPQRCKLTATKTGGANEATTTTNNDREATSSRLDTTTCPSCGDTGGHQAQCKELPMVMKKNNGTCIKARTHYIRLTNKNRTGQLRFFLIRSPQFHRIMESITIAPMDSNHNAHPAGLNCLENWPGYENLVNEYNSIVMLCPVVPPKKLNMDTTPTTLTAPSTKMTSSKPNKVQDCRPAPPRTVTP